MIFEAASYGAVSCNVHDVRLHPVNRDYDVIGAVDSNSFYAHKYIQGSGIAIDWFVDTFVREETTDKKEAFNKIEALATGLQPGSERMLSVGLLGGSAIPFDSERHGLFMGHTFAHHKGHFYHALLEGFSYDLALTLESLAGQYPEYAQNSIKLIGGGAASSIWPQMLADVTGRTFERLSREDVALLGATLLAASAVGDVPNLNAVAKSHVQVKTVYTPDETRHAAYAPYIQLYHSFVQQLRPLYQELNRM